METKSNYDNSCWPYCKSLGAMRRGGVPKIEKTSVCDFKSGELVTVPPGSQRRGSEAPKIGELKAGDFDEMAGAPPRRTRAAREKASERVTGPGWWRRLSERVGVARSSSR
jgi:hypothetical protein